MTPCMVRQKSTSSSCGRFGRRDKVSALPKRGEERGAMGTYVVHGHDDEQLGPPRRLVQDLPERVLLVEKVVGLARRRAARGQLLTPAQYDEARAHSHRK